jgi:hypothetical protein
MLRRVFQGRQDLTVSDTANDISKNMWEACGGSTSLLHSLNWLHPLRPATSLVEIASMHRSDSVGRSLLRGAGRLADLAAVPILARLTGAWRDRDGEGGYSLEEFDAKIVLSALRATAEIDILPVYDARTLDWILSRVGEKAESGAFEARVVKNKRGRRIGWFVFIVGSHGVAEAVQAFAQKGARETVLRAMTRTAKDMGATLLHGRVDPLFMRESKGLYRRNLCFLHGGAWTLVHASQADLLTAFLTGRVFFSSLEGERWTRFNVMFRL